MKALPCSLIFSATAQNPPYLGSQPNLICTGTALGCLTAPKTLP